MIVSQGMLSKKSWIWVKVQIFCKSTVFIWQIIQLLRVTNSKDVDSENLTFMLAFFSKASISS